MAETNKCYIIKYDDGGLTISYIHGIFSTKEKAENEMKFIVEKYGLSSIYYFIEGYEIK